MLGSGLGGLAERIGESGADSATREIPGFPAARRCAGHEGELVAGTLGGVPVLAQSGRFHMYEGHDAATCALPVRVFAALGVTDPDRHQRRRRHPAQPSAPAP